jgi:mannose-binding lectin 2
MNSLLLLLGAALCEQKMHEQPLLRLQTPYLESSMDSPLWSFGRSTLIEVRKYVRLTPDLPSKDGWLWAKNKMSHDSWQVEVNAN